MVTVAILSFGIVALYYSFFISVDAAQMAADRLAAQEWAERKIWEEEDAFRKTRQIDTFLESGTFKSGVRTFNWTKRAGPVDWDASLEPAERQYLDDHIKGLVLNISWNASGHERGMIFSDNLRL